MTVENLKNIIENTLKYDFSLVRTSSDASKIENHTVIPKTVGAFELRVFSKRRE